MLGFSDGQMAICLLPSRTNIGLVSFRTGWSLAWVWMPASCDEARENPGAAVHDRDLFGVDLDGDVIDAESGKRRKQVFHGLHRRAVCAERGRVARCGSIDGNGRHLNAAEISADEYNARAGEPPA